MWKPKQIYLTTTNTKEAIAIRFHQPAEFYRRVNQTVSFGYSI